MKIERGGTFQPVVLTIETQEELDYMYALINSSTSHVCESASDLEITLKQSPASCAIQMNLYNKISALYS